MNRWLFTLTALSALGCGVTGGVFFAFSTFVMRALGRLPAVQGIAAMQSVNVVVVNPAFVLAFLGSGACCVLLAVIGLGLGPSPMRLLQLAATATYLLGCVGVTMAFNVPRNSRLAALTPDSVEAGHLWARYLVEWTAYNHVRTAASVLAAALLIVSLFVRDGGPQATVP